MSRLEWILAGALGILLIAVVVLGLILWLRPGIGTPPPLPSVKASAPPTLSLERTTAMLAYNAARDQATSWESDAQLVQASATWPQGASLEEMLAGMAIWDFTFLSPSSGAAAIISVTEDEARVIGERSVPQELALQDVSGWQVDSPDAIARLMQEGGETFLRDAGATTMTASLSLTTERGHIEWFVSLISRYRGDSFSVRVNASNGEVTAVETAP